MSSSVLLLFYVIGSIYDIRENEIPIWLFGVTFCVALILQVITRSLSLINMAGGISLGIWLLLFGFLSQQKIGYGDGAAFCVSGMLLGFYPNLELLTLSVFISAIVGVFCLLRRKRKSGFPMFPIIAVSYGGILLWGS